MAYEGQWLGGLGDCYRSLGEYRRAIELYEQALAIAREIEDRPREAWLLDGLGNCSLGLGEVRRAIGLFVQAVEIADAVEYAQSQSEARGDLARAQLLSGDLELAAAAVEAALKYPFPRNDAQASLIHGIVLIRQGRRQHARDALSEAVARAESQLQRATTNFTALDTKALALCGLAVLGDGSRLDEATRAFRTARGVTDAVGVVKGVLDLLAELSIADSTSVLGSSVRDAAIGKTEPELT